MGRVKILPPLASGVVRFKGVIILGVAPPLAGSDPTKVCVWCFLAELYAHPKRFLVADW